MALTKRPVPLISRRPVLPVVLAAGLLLGSAPLAGAFSLPFGNKASEPATAKAGNFLPPVAIINGPVEAQGPDVVESVDLGAVKAGPTLSIRPRVTRLSGKLGLDEPQQKNEVLESLLVIQKEIDQDDLKSLWEATVERNPVIRFSLEKLNTPHDLQGQKSSVFLNKVLSAMVQGATIGATMLPGGSYYQNMTAMATGQAAQNFVDQYTKPKVSNLSATEQIQLAGLLEDLRARLMKSYHSYKQTLVQLDAAHTAATDASQLYTQAQQSKDTMAEMLAANSYYQAVQHETDLRHTAKMHRLQLERLAGVETVDNLQLALQFDKPEPVAETPPPSPEDDEPTAAAAIGPEAPEPANTPPALIGPLPKAATKSRSGSEPQLTTRLSTGSSTLVGPDAPQKSLAIRKPLLKKSAAPKPVPTHTEVQPDEIR